MYQVTAWKCEYCGEVKANKQIMENHEKSCLKNPDTINCLICVHRVVPSDLNNRSHCELSGKQCSKATSAKCDQFHKKEGC